MQSTQKMTARLATPRIDREVIARGYRSTALADRLSTQRARHDAAEGLCRLAERKPTWLYEARSKGANLPDQRLDAAIVDGIRDRYITPEVLADYFGDLFAIYRAMMPGAADAHYTDVAREKSEAAHATMRAHMEPTPENTDRAVRELLEDVIVSTAHAKTLQRGSER